jgi:hypothetical protein
VKEALKQTALQHVDAQVAAGNLTAEQAQRLRDAINSEDFAGLGPLGHGKHGGGFKFGGGDGPRMQLGGLAGIALDSLAGFLGVTPDVLRTELREQSLAQVAQAHGKTPDALKAFITSSAQARVNEAVSAGRLTQQQADAMLQALNSRLDDLINRVHEARGPRGFQRGSEQRPAPSTTTPGTSFFVY